MRQKIMEKFLRENEKGMHVICIHFNIVGMIELLQIPLLRDNYSVIVHDPEEGFTLVVDPAEAEPVAAVLVERGWTLTHILNTHWHQDHVGGNLTLKSLYGATVLGAQAPGESIPGLDLDVWSLSDIVLGRTRVEILKVPGHTPHHVAYYFPDEAILFAGDTLFGLGCGRLLGGTAEALWSSLDLIRQLPPETRVFCAHEYTEANARFAVSVDPSNEVLRNRQEEIVERRSRGEPTVPFVLSGELATNPFLRPESPVIRGVLGMSDTASNAEVFRELRARKDHF